MGYAQKGSTMYKQEIIQGMKFLRLNEAPYVVPALIPTSPLTWITWWAELKAKEILTSPHNEGCFVSNGKILVLVKDQGLYVTSHPTEVEPILLRMASGGENLTFPLEVMVKNSPLRLGNFL